MEFQLTTPHLEDALNELAQRDQHIAAALERWVIPRQKQDTHEFCQVASVDAQVGK